ncbi:DUF721 domain-containing protein [Flexivirga caeni]|uniref:DUF721 domain-containing protein n=1 Tax=Flexivirga caeni TaxID=2294115 RepID=A0A3M9M405_9MICO|nr:DciA family protein [Flexivirga caeni]RNI19663.1 DUF721 domain-containing protein [Flexivirga caeni]
MTQQPDDEETAAAESLDAMRDALQRARIAAREQGFRPGSPVPRRVRKAADLGTGRARDDGRDPAPIGDQLDRLLVDRGWQVDVAAGSVLDRWAQIAGETVAAHSRAVSFEGGELTVRADSTAWATQLRLLSSTLLGKIAAEVGADVVQSLRVVGPNAPSWKKGPRAVRDGRGPRDTYG